MTSTMQAKMREKAELNYASYKYVKLVNDVYNILKSETLKPHIENKIKETGYCVVPLGCLCSKGDCKWQADFLEDARIKDLIKEYTSKYNIRVEKHLEGLLLRSLSYRGEVRMTYVPTIDNFRCIMYEGMKPQKKLSKKEAQAIYECLPALPYHSIFAYKGQLCFDVLDNDRLPMNECMCIFLPDILQELYKAVAPKREKVDYIYNLVNSKLQVWH